MTNEVKNVAHFILARSEAEQMRSYLDRGRRFQGSTDEFLSATYVKAVAAWASKPPPW